MKLMTGAFSKKTSLTQKIDVTFILKIAFSGEIVNIIWELQWEVECPFLPESGYYSIRGL